MLDEHDSSQERQLLLDGLREGIRLDGRALDQLRDLEISFGDDYGSVDVKLGKTRVFVQISASVTQPLPDRKFDGIFNIATELSHMASPAFEVGRPTQAETVLSRILEKAIRRSNALDTESLCIKAGVKCWTVRADVHVLDYDGGLVDACCIAVVAGLQHFRRPDVSVQGDEVTVYTYSERVPVPLSMMHYPYTVTFSYFDDGKFNCVDATLAEQQVRDGEMIVTMNKHGEICQIAKYGGCPVGVWQTIDDIDLTLARVQEIDRLVNKRLDEDKKRRNPAELIAELSAENDR